MGTLGSLRDQLGRHHAAPTAGGALMRRAASVRRRLRSDARCGSGGGLPAGGGRLRRGHCLLPRSQRSEALLQRRLACDQLLFSGGQGGLALSQGRFPCTGRRLALAHRHLAVGNGLLRRRSLGRRCGLGLSNERTPSAERTHRRQHHRKLKHSGPTIAW